MAELKVIATVDNQTYGLEQQEDVYTDAIVAPEESTQVSVLALDEYGNTSEETETLHVITEWLPPKTDWTPEDYFNHGDYNRLIGNLMYLKVQANDLFRAFDILQMGEEKTYVSLLYAREMNNIEENLAVINQNTYGLDIGEKQMFYANKSTPLWSEFNRIESACLLLYNTLKAHKESLPRLAFTLGSQKGLRV